MGSAGTAGPHVPPSGSNTGATHGGAPKDKHGSAQTAAEAEGDNAEETVTQSKSGASLRCALRT